VIHAEVFVGQDIAKTRDASPFYGGVARHRTFGCENSQPTFRYSLLDGVKEAFLINPTVVDARTEVTTTLLSKQPSNNWWY
jgi:hypothetical protein